jgi:signal transduction histidine kinase
MKEQLAYTLFLINLGILILSGSFGYVLAGRTLKPIKIMVDEQNQFISDSSHQLRTPIATLQAEMEGILLEKKITDKQARQLTKSNLEELSNLKNLANRLLLLTKNHSLLTDQKTKNISLAQILEKAKSRVNAMAKKKKINIDLKLSDAIIKGNQDRLTEVFVVLLDNAVKYSPSGSTVKVNLEKTTRKIKVSVIDQGMGISQEDLPHIFERFYRADKSRSETDGFGLGLSIAKNIIDSHHGSIEVFSRLNKGTTFEVNLPV